MIKRVLVFILIIILIYGFSVHFSRLTGKVAENIEYEKQSAFLLRVIDGDTIETDNGTIRLLGINTPEKGRHYAELAFIYLKQFENSSIEILRDSEDTDKYDRKLRYVFYKNEFLNVEIVQKGFATTFMLSELKYKEKFEKAEDFAKQNNLGLWKPSTDKCADCIKLVELNYTEEFFVLKNSCNFDCAQNWYAKDDANHFFEIDKISANKEQTFASKTKVWNNEGDRFFLRDFNGRLVIFYEY